MPVGPLQEKGTAQPEWRGDTMNSFRTLFGREIRVECPGGDGIVGFQGLRRFGVEEKLCEKVYEFYRLCYSIGNFIPLPNARIGRVSMNTFRTKWHDYFDRFLIELHAHLVLGKTDEDRGIPNLTKLIARNSFFWNEYTGSEGWRKFITRFMLEDYCDENLVPRILYPELWHWKPRLTRADYLAACHTYLSTATPLILRRGSRMCAKLHDAQSADPVGR